MQTYASAIRQSAVSVQARSHCPPVLMPFVKTGTQAPIGPQSLLVVQVFVHEPRGSGGEQVNPAPPQSLSKRQSAPSEARGSQNPAVDPGNAVQACPPAQLGGSAVLHPGTQRNGPVLLRRTQRSPLPQVLGLVHSAPATPAPPRRQYKPPSETTRSHRAPLAHKPSGFAQGRSQRERSHARPAAHGDHSAQGSPSVLPASTGPASTGPASTGPASTLIMEPQPTRAPPTAQRNARMAGVDGHHRSKFRVLLVHVEANRLNALPPLRLLTALLGGGTQFSPPRAVAASRFTPALRNACPGFSPSS